MVNSDVVAPISVFRSDPESRLGVTAGYGTSVNTLFAGVLGLVLSVLFFTVVFFLPQSGFKDAMLERGPTQYVCVFLGLWSVSILYLKRLKLKLQRRALSLSVIPENTDFVLSSQTADDLIGCLLYTSDAADE